MADRQSRKLVSQTIAFGIYRWIAVWLIVFFLAGKGTVGQAAALVVVAVDIGVNGLAKVLLVTMTEKTQRDWYERLTTRIFYKLFFEAVRARDAVDVDELFRQATREAVADIERAEEDERAAVGMFGTLPWHWFGGAFSFIWLIIGTLLYYGSALYLGSSGSF